MFTAYLVWLYLSVVVYLILGFSLDAVPFVLNFDFRNQPLMNKIFYFFWPITFPLGLAAMLLFIIGLLLLLLASFIFYLLFDIGEILFPPSRTRV